MVINSVNCSYKTYKYNCVAGGPLSRAYVYTIHLHGPLRNRPEEPGSLPILSPHYPYTARVCSLRVQGPK